jgi:hypothetical protein
MWLLARFRIMPKIIVVISLPAATAVAIGRLGVHAMASLNAGADNMSFAARRALAPRGPIKVLSPSIVRSFVSPRTQALRTS